MCRSQTFTQMSQTVLFHTDVFRPTEHELQGNPLSVRMFPLYSLGVFCFHPVSVRTPNAGDLLQRLSYDCLCSLRGSRDAQRIQRKSHNVVQAAAVHHATLLPGGCPGGLPCALNHLYYRRKRSIITKRCHHKGELLSKHPDMA